MDRKAIVIPGAFQMVKNYGGYPGVDIWLGESANEGMIENSNWIIAHSLGANYALSLPFLRKQKLILINPPVKGRSFIDLLVWDMRYLFSRGREVKMEKMIPVARWWYAFKRAFRLAKVDVLEGIRKIPKENIIIVRGTGDRFFCDQESVDLIRRAGISLIEVAAGHNWDQKIADAVDEIISAKAGEGTVIY